MRLNVIHNTSSTSILPRTTPTSYRFSYKYSTPLPVPVPIPIPIPVSVSVPIPQVSRVPHPYRPACTSLLYSISTRTSSTTWWQSKRKYCSSVISKPTPFVSQITDSFRAKLSTMEKRHQELSDTLNTEKRAEYSGGKIKDMSKENADLTFIVDNLKIYDNAKKELAELAKIIWANNKQDPELLSMAVEDYNNTVTVLKTVEKDLLLALLPKEEADSRNAILEVRPGTGGEEASLFCMEMLSMYEKYAASRGWSFEMISLNTTDKGGCKDASAIITGQGVFGVLKYERGVHRVQVLRVILLVNNEKRIPETEANGRLHTSTTTVAVLPEAEEVDVKLDEKDLRIDTFRSQGAGGQSVNKTESAIRITHIPTGVVVSIQDERSQHKVCHAPFWLTFQNKARAMKILRSRLYEMEREKLESARSSERKQQMGSGERHERIRTYNYSQDRITDHRCNTTKHGVEQMLNGELLDEFAEAMKVEEVNQALKNLLQ